MSFHAILAQTRGWDGGTTWTVRHSLRAEPGSLAAPLLRRLRLCYSSGRRNGHSSGRPVVRPAAVAPASAHRSGHPLAQDGHRDVQRQMANPSGKVFSKIASVISTPWRSTIGASERRESSSCCSPVPPLGEKRLQPLAFVSPPPTMRSPLEPALAPALAQPLRHCLLDLDLQQPPPLRF